MAAAGARKRQANGARVRSSEGAQARYRDDPADTTCCPCDTPPPPTQYYPLLYCPDGTVETGQVVALTDAQALTYVGKILSVEDPEGYGNICAFVGPDPVELGDYDLIPIPGVSPFEDCDECCSCAGVTQPTTVLVSFTIPACPASGAGPWSWALASNTGGGGGGDGCFDYFPITNPGEAPSDSWAGFYCWPPYDPPGPPEPQPDSTVAFGWIQRNADSNDGGSIVPADWDCWWELYIGVSYAESDPAVVTPGGDPYNILLYKRGGQTALGTYTALDARLFSTAVVS